MQLATGILLQLLHFVPLFVLVLVVRWVPIVRRYRWDTIDAIPKPANLLSFIFRYLSLGFVVSPSLITNIGDETEMVIIGNWVVDKSYLRKLRDK